jgi:hypothetical protein
MFARWTGHVLVSGDVTWTASLVRAGPAKRQQHLCVLGSIAESRLPDSQARRRFWLVCEANLAPHDPTPLERDQIMATLCRRVPALTHTSNGR